MSVSVHACMCLCLSVWSCICVGIFVTGFMIIVHFVYIAGMTRQERWDRAKMNGLEPPEEIETILSQHPDNPEVQDW